MKILVIFRWTCRIRNAGILREPFQHVTQRNQYHSSGASKEKRDSMSLSFVSRVICTNSAELDTGDRLDRFAPSWSILADCKEYDSLSNYTVCVEKNVSFNLH